MDSPRTAPSFALAAYSEDLVTGRRVVVFGDALSGLAETLVERGARLVHVYDEDPTRVSEAAARSTSASISFAPLTSGGIAARDGAFDVGFVDDVANFRDPAQLVTRLRRALSARGVGFVWTNNPDVSPLWSPGPAKPTGASRPSLSYYDLYDLVSTQFDEVRMVGQTPFAGFALADFSPDSESEFSIDTGFVPGGAEEPERYVAVCSHFPVSVEPFCVVQMAAKPLVFANRDPIPAALDETALDDTAAADTALQDTALPIEVPTDTALAETARRLGELSEQLAAERANKSKLEQLLKDVNDELQRRDEWVQELESRAATADERADAAEAALDQTNRRLARLENSRNASKETEQVAHLQRQLHERTQENIAQARQLEELQRKLAESERKLAELQPQSASLRNALEQRGNELSRAERDKRQLEDTLVRVNAQLDEALAEAKSKDAAAAQLPELQESLTELREQVGNLRSDLQLAGEEISRAERQLAEQGHTVRQLRADLTETERFAALLIAERDERLDDPREGETVAAPAKTPASSETNERKESIPAPAPKATDDLPLVAESEHLASPLAPREGADSEYRVLLDRAREREAELRATLESTRWTVEELENRLAEGSNEGALLEKLYRAEGQLQRQATLIEQYERAARDESRVGLDATTT